MLLLACCIRLTGCQQAHCSARRCRAPPCVALGARSYRVTQFLTKEGFYSMWNWFDDRTWYPLGRTIGGTLYPVSDGGPAVGTTRHQRKDTEDFGLSLAPWAHRWLVVGSVLGSRRLPRPCFAVRSGLRPASSCSTRAGPCWSLAARRASSSRRAPSTASSTSSTSPCTSRRCGPGALACAGASPRHTSPLAPSSPVSSGAACSGAAATRQPHAPALGTKRLTHRHPCHPGPRLAPSASNRRRVLRL